MTKKEKKQVFDRDRVKRYRALASRFLIRRQVFLAPTQLEEFERLLAPLGESVFSLAAALASNGLIEPKRRVVSKRLANHACETVGTMKPIGDASPKSKKSGPKEDPGQGVLL